MELYKRIEQEMRTALKGGDSVRLSVLRMLVSEIRMFAITKNVKDPQDPDVLKIIQKQIKQHKESIDQFQKGSRGDLADKEAVELKILEAYVPEQLSEEELAAIIKQVIAETGAINKSELGKVMKAVMDKVSGRADGKIINQMVAALLK